MMMEQQRRTFLKILTSLPIIGGAVLAANVVLRFFKPTAVGGI